jgi:hypothetical protein
LFALVASFDRDLTDIFAIQSDVAKTILVARFQGKLPNADSGFAETREQLNQMVQKSPENPRQLPIPAKQ